jgi:Flp pilus assembly protein CpaB
MGKAKKPLAALFIALLATGVFAGATYFYVSQHIQLVTVVTAAAPIPPRTRVEPAMLRMAQVPVSAAPQDFAPGKNVFAEQEFFTGEIGLHAGEIVTRGKVFKPEDIVHAHTLTLAPGESILGVATDLARSAGGAIFPGSRVRALAYIKPDARQETEQPPAEEPARVKVLFDNLRVVGVINSEAADATDKEQRSRVPAVVKLAVNQEQSRVLIRHQEEHRVWFAVLPETQETVATVQ